MRALLDSVLGCKYFLLISLSISCHSLLACRVSAEKSADSLMEFPCLSLAFPLLLWRFSWSLIFAIIMAVCFGAILSELILFAILCASLVWMSFSFPRLEKFSAIMSSHILFAPFSLFSSWSPNNVNFSTHDITISPEVLLNCPHSFSFIFFPLFSLSDFH